ncbi:MAG: class I SAM-dependent methyltransferase [Caldilineaceae bacterium]
MSGSDQNSPTLSTNSAGQSLTDASQLDNHYRLAQPEYDACIAKVGIQPGWHVLDAGCGNGVFIPHIARAVGSTGMVTAVDLAPENVLAVEQFYAQARFSARLQTRVSSLVQLPFADHTFDCTWCANVTQYLTSDELDRAIAEFVRVTKPGGVIAIKEADVTCWQFYPVDSKLLWRLLDAGVKTGSTQAIGSLRGWELLKWIRSHGIEVTLRETTLVERLSPLPAFALPFLSGLLKWLADIAQQLELSEQDKADWRSIRDSADEILTHPDFCYREFFVLIMGKAPN